MLQIGFSAENQISQAMFCVSVPGLAEGKGQAYRAMSGSELTDGAKLTEQSAVEAVIYPETNRSTSRFANSDGNTRQLQVPAASFIPVLGLYLAIRVALLLCNILAATITRASNWLGPFSAWDGHWYVQVARTWYGAPGLASAQLTYAPGGFEPGWPAVIKFGTLFGLSYSGSAFLMSVVVGAATAYAIWLLSLELIPEHSMMATTAALVFPGAAFTFGIAYSEVLSIGCIAAALFLLFRRRWAGAGIASMVATGTSSLAIVLPLVFVVEAFLAIRERREFRSIWAVALSPLGFIGFAAYLGYHSGDPFYWWKLQGNAWGARIEPGYIFHWFSSAAGSGWGVFWIAAFGLFILAYLVVSMMVSGFPLGAKVYCLAVAVMLLINPALGPKPRFLFWLFPSLLLLPRNLSPKILNPLLIFMALLLPVVAIAYTTIGNTVAQP
ncbi:MAG: DUF2029 domain-containing protein [Actinomycetota bacterium]|nr:MAG: DUF2029 domain-containing protein [Actinomycetota bacterium]